MLTMSFSRRPDLHSDSPIGRYVVGDVWFPSNLQIEYMIDCDMLAVSNGINHASHSALHPRGRLQHEWKPSMKYMGV